MEEARDEEWGKKKTLIYSKSYFSSWEEYCFLQGANEMLMSEKKKDPKSLFVGLLSHFIRKKEKKRKSANAAVWHQLYSQRDYHDPLMDV